MNFCSHNWKKTSISRSYDNPFLGMVYRPEYKCSKCGDRDEILDFKIGKITKSNLLILGITLQFVGITLLILSRLY